MPDRPLPRLHFHLPLDPSRLSRARERVRDYLEHHGVGRDARDSIVLCVEEACTNAIRHSGAGQDMQVRLRFDDADLVAVVKDTGRCFPLGELDLERPPDPLAAGGRGLFLIATLMDDLRLSCRNGLEVRMRKQRVLTGQVAAEEAALDEGLVEVASPHRRARRLSFLEELGEGFGALDWEYRVVHANQYALDLLGVDRATAVGAVVWDILPQIRDAPVDRVIRDAMELGRSARVDYHSPVTGDWFEVRSYPTATGVSVYFQLINERKRVEQERRDLLRRLETERSQLSGVLLSLTEGVIISGADGTVLMMNEEAVRLHGFDDVEQLQRGLSDWRGFELRTLNGRLLTHDDYPHARAGRGERFMDEQLRVFRAAGQERVWSFSGTPVYDEHGQLAQAVLTIRDVTAEKRAEAEQGALTARIDQERARLREILDALPVGIGLVGADGSVLEVNRGMRELLAGDPPRAQGVAGYEAYQGRHHDSGRPMRPEEWPPARVVLTGEPAEELIDTQRMDGKPLTLRMEAVPLPHPQGRLEHVVVIAEDVTDMVRRQRLSDALNEIATRLTSSLDPESLLRDVVRLSAAALDAHSAVICTIDGRSWRVDYAWGRVQTLVGETFAAPPGGILDTLRERREPLALTDVEREREIDASVLSKLEIRAAIIAPLFRRGEITGALFLEYHGEPRGFGRDDVDFARKASSLASATLENARRYQREREAARLGVALAEVDALVHSSQDLPEIAHHALVAGVKALGADSGVVDGLEDGAWAVWFDYGFEPSIVGHRFTDEQNAHGVLAARTRKTVAVDDTSSDDRVDAPAMKAYGIKSIIVAPVVVHQRTIAGLCFNFSSSHHHFTRSERQFVTRLASSLSVAVQNAELHHAERRSTRLAQALNAVNEILLSSLTMEETLQRIVDEASMAAGADTCVLLQPEPADWVVTNVHALDPALVGARFPRAETPMLELTAQTRQPQLVEDAQTDPSPDHEFARRHGMRAYMLLPLVMQDRVLGIIDFGFAQPARFHRENVEFAQRLSTAMSLAMENARRFEELRYIAVTLQENMIRPLPAIPGLETGRVMRPANEPELVGGDFSDVFALDDRHVAVLIGDVEGKGIKAAGLTETVHTAVSSFALQDRSPAAVLSRTNELLLKRDSLDGQFVTAFLMVADLQTGEARYASAGHPAPMALSARRCHTLQLSYGLPLGAFEWTYEERHVTLEEDDQLVLFTDGVTEARRDGQLFGEARVREVLCGLDPHLPVQAVVERLRDAAVGFAGDLRDDLHILGVRVSRAR